MRIFLFTIAVAIVIYLLFGNNISQQWFKDNATLFNLFLAFVAALAGIGSWLWSGKSSSSNEKEKGNIVKDIKISGKKHKIEIKQSNK